MRAIRGGQFVNGDTATVLTTPPTLATAATKTSPVGEYPIIVGGAVGADYTITYVGGMLTVVASGWQNPVDPWDVSGEGEVTPLDVLVVINYINAHPGSAVLPSPPASPPPFYDVTGDGHVMADDALVAINYLNTHAAASAEGEAVGLAPLVQADDALWSGPAWADTTRELTEREVDPGFVLAGKKIDGKNMGRIPRSHEGPFCHPCFCPFHRRVASPVSQPADLDLAELANGDLELVLDSLAEEIGVAWSQPRE